MKKTALITGIRGQDAAYLSQLLLEKGYKVIGTDRRSGGATKWRLERLGVVDKIVYEYMDLVEFHNVCEIIEKYQPDECYNLAAQSFVQASFSQPFVTSNVNFFGVLNLLEAIRKYSPKTKFYQASTSEMFGKIQENPQTEKTPFYPKSPYGVAKLASHWEVINYRESYNLFACCGILFNHESPLRGEEFVTRKITKGLINWYHNQEPIYLGNIYARRDFSHAKDAVNAMWLMLQQKEPKEYVIASGQTYSIKDFINECLKQLHVNYKWINENKGVKEYCIDQKLNSFYDTSKIVIIDPTFFRPNEVDILRGWSEKAKKELGWSPSYGFESLIKEMLEEDAKLYNTVKK